MRHEIWFRFLFFFFLLLSVLLYIWRRYNQDSHAIDDLLNLVEDIRSYKSIWISVWTAYELSLSHSAWRLSFTKVCERKLMYIHFFVFESTIVMIITIARVVTDNHFKTNHFHWQAGDFDLFIFVIIAIGWIKIYVFTCTLHNKFYHMFFLSHFTSK